jgi:hypothetical protein
MSRYVVQFMKVVLGENGHEAEICQRSMEIDAADKLEAADLAKVSFCESERVKEWSLHADHVRITDAEFRLNENQDTVALAAISFGLWASLLFAFS